MKTMILAAGLLALAATAAQAQYGYGSNRGSGYGSNSSSTHVDGHFSSNGSYTQPHYRSSPNSTDLDNYGTRGNTNPFTGATGTRSPRY